MSKQVLQEIMNSSKKRNKKAVEKIAVDNANGEFSGWIPGN